MCECFVLSLNVFICGIYVYNSAQAYLNITKHAAQKYIVLQNFAILFRFVFFDVLLFVTVC